MTNHYFCSLRNALLMKHNIKSIIQLPDNVFSKTEARTHIMIIEKNRKGKSEVEVAKANSDGEITHSLSIDKNKLVQRMDFDFHYWVSQLTKPIRNYLTIGDVAVSLSRGNKTKKDLQNLEIPYFHTTSFNFHGTYLSLGFSQTDFPSNLSLAIPGDILIARVGKRCIGKVAMVKHGFIPISDCIYRLRVADEYRDEIFKSLLSSEGQSWLEANAHGVCARVISKIDLLQYPIVNV
jgi:type I restriction enzyme M protein